jgi:hypothetical protein
MCALPHLASHILGAILRRLRSDWQDKYDIAPCLAETVRVPRLTDTDSSGDALQPPREWLTRQRTGSERQRLGDIIPLLAGRGDRKWKPGCGSQAHR